MKIRILTTFLAVTLIPGIVFPVFGDSEKKKEITSETKSRVSAEGFDLDDKDNFPKDKILLKSMLEVENSMEEYILSFEAYLEARRSTDNRIIRNLGQFLKMYRESYADHLKIMRECKLIHPMMPKDPAKWYNEKNQEVNLLPASFRAPVLKDKIIKVQEWVQTLVPPKEIRSRIVANLPVDRVFPPGPKEMTVQPYASVAAANSAITAAENNCIANDNSIASRENLLSVHQAALATVMQYEPDNEEKIKKIRKGIDDIRKDLEKAKKGP